MSSHSVISFKTMMEFFMSQRDANSIVDLLLFNPYKTSTIYADSVQNTATQVSGPLYINKKEKTRPRSTLATGTIGPLRKKQATGKLITDAKLVPPPEKKATGKPPQRIKYFIANNIDGKRIVVRDTNTRQTVREFTDPSGALISSFAFSPDGKLLVSGHHNGYARIFDVKTARIKKTLRSHDACISVAVSRDSKLLATGGEIDGKVVVSNIVTGEILKTFQYLFDNIRSVAFTPDNRRVVCGGDGGEDGGWVSVRNFTDLDEKKLGFDSNNLHIFSVACSPDGRYIAGGGDDGVIRIWNSRSGVIQKEINPHMSTVLSIAFSPNGSLMACGLENGSVHIWRVEGWELLLRFYAHDVVRVVSFAPNSALLATGGDDGVLRVWSFVTGDLSMRVDYKQHVEGEYHSVAFYPVGIRTPFHRIDLKTRPRQGFTMGTRPLPSPGEVTRPSTGELFMNVNATPAFHSMRPPPGDSDAKAKAAAATNANPKADAKAKAAAATNVDPEADAKASQRGESKFKYYLVQIWIQGKVIQKDKDNMCLFQPDNKNITAYWVDPNETSIRKLDRVVGSAEIRENDEVKVFYEKWVKATIKIVVTVSEEDKNTLDLKSRDLEDPKFDPKRVSEHLPQDDKSLKHISQNKELYVSSFIGPKGQFVAIIVNNEGGPHYVEVRHFDSGRIISRHMGHNAYISSVAFSPNGDRVVSGSQDRTVRIWDAATGTLQRELEGHSNMVLSVAFSPNGERVASGCWGGMLRIWDVNAPTFQELKGDNWGVTSVAFSPNGASLASGKLDRTVRIYDLKKNVSKECLGHGDFVMSVAFSPDGALVASGSRDRTVRIWNAATGQPIKMLGGHSDSVNSVAFSPDGQNVVTLDVKHNVRIWNIGVDRQEVKLEQEIKMGTICKQVTYSPCGHYILVRCESEIVVFTKHHYTEAEDSKKLEKVLRETLSAEKHSPNSLFNTIWDRFPVELKEYMMLKIIHSGEPSETEKKSFRDTLKQSVPSLI